MRRVICTFAAAILMASPLLPQTRSVPSLGETIEVAIVNVDVVVTDREGKRVRGLTKADFEIREDGRLQPITHFAEYSDDASQARAEVEGAESVAPEQQRTLVIFLEPFQAKQFRIAPYIDSLKHLVRDTVRPADSVSVVVFDGTAETRLEATDDLDVVENELDVFAEELQSARIDRTAGVVADVTQMMDFEKEGAAMAAGAMKRPVTSGETIASNVAHSAAMLAEFEMRRRVAAINAVLGGLAGVEGKKAMIVAAHRLGSFSGAEYYFTAASTIATGVEKGRMSGSGVSDRFLATASSVMPAGETDALDNRNRMRELIANANASGVSLYPIFPSGLDDISPDPDVPDVTRQVLANEMGMRQEVAQQTGGLSGYGADIVTLLPEVASDLSNYYSLAYRVPATGEDQARDLEVRVKRAGLQVRTRTQFVEKSDESRMRDRILAAMYGMEVESPMRIDASLGTPKAAGLRKKQLPLSVRVPIGALTLVPQETKHAGAFSVFVMSGADSGEVSELTRRTQPFEIPAADAARASANHFTYDVDIVVNDGADHVVVGVLDEVSKEYGLVRLAIDAPTKDELSRR